MSATSPLAIQTNSELNARLARRAEPRAGLVPAESAWERKLRAKLEQKPREAAPEQPASDRTPAKTGAKATAAAHKPAGKTSNPGAPSAGPEAKQSPDSPRAGDDAPQPTPEGQGADGAVEASAEAASGASVERPEDQGSEKSDDGESIKPDAQATANPEKGVGPVAADRPITIAELNAALATLDATVLPKGLLQDLGLLRGPGTARVAQLDQQSPGDQPAPADASAPQGATGSGEPPSLPLAPPQSAPPAADQRPSAEASKTGEREGNDASPATQATDSSARPATAPGERAARSKVAPSGPVATGVGNAAPEPKPAALSVIDRLEGLVGQSRPFVLEAAKGAAPAAGRTPVDESAFQAQVARGLGAAMQQDDGQVTLRLNPEQLGSLKIDVSVDRTDVSLRFEAGTRQTAELIDRALPDLRRSLEEKGLVVREASVHVSDAPEAAAREPVRHVPDHPPGWGSDGGGGAPGDTGGSMDSGGRGSAGWEGGEGSGWRQDRSAEAAASVEPARTAFGGIEQEWGDGIALRLNALA